MLRNRSLVMVLLVMVALTANATRAFARHESRSVRAADEAQMRELLANLAAASGKPAQEERTDADLMYEAMLRWNGEPPDSAAINRALEQSKRDAAKVKRATGSGHVARAVTAGPSIGRRMAGLAPWVMNSTLQSAGMRARTKSRN